jgi:hypothetical protein
MYTTTRRRRTQALAVLAIVAWGAIPAEAGWWARRRQAHAAPAPVAAPMPVAVPATAAAPVPTSYQPSGYPMLGTFFPSPSLMVRGNFPAGGGFSPLQSFGDTTMALYGPLSPYRAYTAPVVTYERGYDGRVVPREAYSFSTPNRPELSPVVYPTQASYFYRIRETSEPPWWADGQEWIDKN